MADWMDLVISIVAGAIGAGPSYLMYLHHRRKAERELAAMKEVAQAMREYIKSENDRRNRDHWLGVLSKGADLVEKVFGDREE